MPRANVNSIDIHFINQGAGRPVLFIHGGFGGAQGTLLPGPKPIEQDFPDGMRLIAFDRRNAGLSGYSDDWFDLADIAADARALLDHLDVERCIVVGSSMGGMVALQYISAYRDSVEALGLMNTGPNLMGETRWGARMAERVAHHKRDGDAAVFSASRDELRHPEGASGAYLAALDAIDDDELFRYYRGQVRNMNAFLGHDFTAGLSDISVPTLIVHGNADDVVPYACSELMKEHIAGAELRTIDDAGHGILNYAEARAALGEWLVSLP